jgi:E3 ubiquitin-protein ligase HERC2
LQSEQLDILVTTQNFKRDVGQNKEKFIPNPHANSQLHYEWFKFIGIIMGIGLLSSNIIELDFPSIVWKKIVNKKVGIEDLEIIDHEFYNSIISLREIDKKGIDKDNFNDYIFNNFTTKSSEGLEVEIIKNGRFKKVTFENRFDYVDLILNYRINEFNYQIEAIKTGLFSIIEPRFFSIFTWIEIENLICGSPDIDINILKKHTIYEGYNINSREIKDFWSILLSFTKKERSNYIRFVWGRSRLPNSEDKFTTPMKIQKYVKSKKPVNFNTKRLK